MFQSYGRVMQVDLPTTCKLNRCRLNIKGGPPSLEFWKLKICCLDVPLVVVVGSEWYTATNGTIEINHPKVDRLDRLLPYLDQRLIIVVTLESPSDLGCIWDADISVRTG